MRERNRKNTLIASAPEEVIVVKDASEKDVDTSLSCDSLPSLTPHERITAQQLAKHLSAIIFYNLEAPIQEALSAWSLYRVGGGPETVPDSFSKVLEHINLGLQNCPQRESLLQGYQDKCERMKMRSFYAMGKVNRKLDRNESVLKDLDNDALTACFQKTNSAEQDTGSRELMKKDLIRKLQEFSKADIDFNGIIEGFIDPKSRDVSTNNMQNSVHSSSKSTKTNATVSQHQIDDRHSFFRLLVKRKREYLRERLRELSKLALGKYSFIHWYHMDIHGWPNGVSRSLNDLSHFKLDRIYEALCNGEIKIARK